jgi:hypothetical protein
MAKDGQDLDVHIFRQNYFLCCLLWTFRPTDKSPICHSVYPSQALNEVDPHPHLQRLDVWHGEAGQRTSLLCHSHKKFISIVPLSTDFFHLRLVVTF